MRRMWARIVRERFGARDPRSWKFRFAAQTTGSSLTMQQPLNNIVRAAYQSMALVCGGAQSIFCCTYNEAESVPSKEAQLKEAGMEVVYLGRFQTPETIVSAAVQEDVDIIGLSCLDGEHLPFTPKILGLLKKKNTDIPLMIGGVIPKKDACVLKRMGVSGVFTPGTSLKDIVEHIRNTVEFRIQGPE